MSKIKTLKNLECFIRFWQRKYMIYRVKQFLWAIESHFKEVDYKYVDKFLDSKEKQLFNKLKHNEKHHSIRVCKYAINISKEKNIEIDDKIVGKLSLLHDIGKVEHGLNIFEKSTLVILNKITNGNLKKLDNIKNIDIYYNHGEKGAKLLRKYNKYDREFLEAIEFHHNDKFSGNNKLLDIIRESDNKS